ncbi:MAG TPA: ornithine aminotransferase [Gemmatimonadetes bacterium]|jgi:osmotically-inducible protein OsmY|nr:ornithine aminotransferase [Gemmatimonadota bacterium]
MKTDLQLQRDVLDELKFEPSIREAEIGIAAKGGVVTLTGFVDSYAQKFSAERTAERVGGVKAVADEIKVKLPGAHQRSDTDIAHAAVNALRWDVQVPDDRIKATIEDGWIALEGDVEWQYQKWAAEGAVRNLTGVKGVTNLIAVKPKKASSYEVGQKIKDSMRRHAERDADRITIEAKDGRVTLRGSVSSFAERKDAEHAAWQAQGVTSVDDQIAVMY